jgi:hypothetical protein
MYTVLIVGSLLNNIRIVLFLLDQYCNIFRFTGNTVNAHISRIRSPISLLSIVRSVFYRVKACSVGLPQQFPHPQIPNRKSRDDQQPCKENNGYVSLLIIWCINLFPNNQWQPGLQDIRHLVHRCNYNCSLFVVFVADFMRPPANFISIAVSPCLATSV